MEPPGKEQQKQQEHLLRAAHKPIVCMGFIWMSAAPGYPPSGCLFS